MDGRRLYIKNPKHNKYKHSPLIYITYLIDIFPRKISILHKENQKSKHWHVNINNIVGCCFIELDTPQIAYNVLESYNGIKLPDFTLKLNWVNVKQKDSNIKKTIETTQKKYSVNISYTYIYLIYYRSMLVI